jgi:hypothetical protein
MFDLKRLTLMLFLSALASGACATLTLPNSDSSWSLGNEIGSIPLTIESTSYQSIVEPQAPLASADKNNIRVKRFKSNIIMPLFLKR